MGKFLLSGEMIEVQGPATWDGESVMVYVQLMPDDELEVMMYNPESEEEIRDARHFFGETNYIRWQTPEELAQLFDGPGPWLVRANQTRQYQFLTTADEGLLFSEGDDEAEIMSHDPAAAVRLTSDEARELILRFSQEFDYGPIAGLYVEPVPASEPLQDYGPADPVGYALEVLANRPPEDETDDDLDDAEE